MVLEARPPGLGEARPRLTGVFHVARLSAFYPSLRVPEAFRRDYRKQNPLQPVLLAAKVLAIGSFIGLAIVLFIRLVKGGGLGWNRLWPGLAALAAFLTITQTHDLLYDTKVMYALWFALGAAMSRAPPRARAG